MEKNIQFKDFTGVCYTPIGQDYPTSWALIKSTWTDLLNQAVYATHTCSQSSDVHAYWSGVLVATMKGQC